MVRKTLKLAEDVELGDDAADALALALCHLGRGRVPQPGRSRRALSPGSGCAEADRRMAPQMIASLSGALMRFATPGAS